MKFNNSSNNFGIFLVHIIGIVQLLLICDITSDSSFSKMKLIENEMKHRSTGRNKCTMNANGPSMSKRIEMLTSEKAIILKQFNKKKIKNVQFN